MTRRKWKEAKAEEGKYMEIESMKESSIKS